MRGYRGVVFACVCALVALTASAAIAAKNQANTFVERPGLDFERIDGGQAEYTAGLKITFGGSNDRLKKTVQRTCRDDRATVLTLRDQDSGEGRIIAEPVTNAQGKLRAVAEAPRIGERLEIQVDAAKVRAGGKKITCGATSNAYEVNH